MVKSWIMFLVILISSFLIPPLYSSNIKLTVLYVLIILFILSVVTILSAPYCLRFSGELKQGKSLKDEKVQYLLTIQNKGIFFYPTIYYSFHNSEFTKSHINKTTFNIRPFSRETREYTIQIPYSGDYPVGIEQIVVTDLLGLFKRTLPVKVTPRLLVYPQSDNAFAASFKKDSQSMPIDIQSYSENYEDVIDVRAYRPQDSLKRVHWKLSAKRNELLVKNYPSMASRSTILFVDAKEIPLDDYIQRLAFEDGIMSRITAAASSAAETHQHTMLKYNGKEIEIKSEDDLNSAFIHIAKIKFESLISDIVKFANRLNESVATMTLVFFCSYMDPDVKLAIEKIVALDHTVSLYYFHSGSIYEDVEELLKDIKVIGVTVTTNYIPLPELKQELEGRGRK